MKNNVPKDNNPLQFLPTLRGRVRIKQLRVWFLANFLALLGYSPAARARVKIHKQGPSIEGKEFREVDFGRVGLSDLNRRLQNDLYNVLDKPLMSENFLRWASSSNFRGNTKNA
jgi:hypothetical protein